MGVEEDRSERAGYKVKEYDIPSLLKLKSNKDGLKYAEKTVYLVAWIACAGKREQTVDAGIYGEPTPTHPGSTPGQTYRTVLLAKCTGRDYEQAANGIHRAVDTDPVLDWVKGMPRYRSERLADSVKLGG